MAPKFIDRTVGSNSNFRGCDPRFPILIHWNTIALDIIQRSSTDSVISTPIDRKDADWVAKLFFHKKFNGIQNIKFSKNFLKLWVE